jgi:hypothetical protein
LAGIRVDPLSAGLLVLLVASGCNPTGVKPPLDAPVASATHRAQPSKPAPTADAGALARETVEPPPSPPRERVESLLLWIENVEGTTAATAGVMFAPAQELVERCLPAQPGVLRVRVARQAGRTDVVVEPESKVDPTNRQCVHDALAAMDLRAGSSADGGAPSDVPSLSCTVHISW